MKQQLARLSPHQNGKVLALLISLVALIALLPLGALAMYFGKPIAPEPTLWLVVAALYLLLSYAFTAIGCLLYNVIARFVGGLEFEARSGSEA
ncbi:hypothetical protein CLD22_19815 [Rubrivivax gelatinosus]|nr:hypothetical protein [Rubrivivax gelatinosus]